MKRIGMLTSGGDCQALNAAPCLEVSTIIFRSRPTPKTLLKAWK